MFGCPSFPLLCSKAEVFMKGMVAHHIWPLYLGGSNDYSNIAFIWEALHGSVHKYIEDQGESPIIRIPTHPSKVWDAWPPIPVLQR